MQRRWRTFAVYTVLASFALPACSGEGGDIADVLPSASDAVNEADSELSIAVPMRKLAEVRLPQEASVEFLEPEDGAVLVLSTFQDGRVPRAYERFARREIGAASLYEELSRSGAPSDLRLALARQDENRRRGSSGQDEAEDEGDGAGVLGREPTLGISTQALTASGFSQKYCHNVWDYLFCWPSTYGNPYVQRRPFSMHGRVHAPTHPVRVRFRRKKVGGWKTLLDQQVLTGWTKYVDWDSYPLRRVRLEVLDNTHPVRFSAYGVD